jgi:hypothetical protein
MVNNRNAMVLRQVCRPVAKGFNPIARAGEAVTAWDRAKSLPFRVPQAPLAAPTVPRRFICGWAIERRRAMKILWLHAREIPEGGSVREIIRTNDPVLVSAVVALLEGADIPHLVFDQNMSVMEGSLGILPRRVLVADDYEAQARRLMQDAGYGRELRPDSA